MLQVLYQAIDKLLEGIPPSRLMASAMQMSERYRKGTPHDHAQSDACEKESRVPPRGEPQRRELQTEEEYLAYLVVRQPATFAALQKALEQLKKRVVAHHFSSVLDVGSGPGTALWALSEHFTWNQAIALELKRPWLELARKLWKEHPQALPVEWKLADITTSAPERQSYDLVMASYSLNEMAGVQEQIDALWAATRQVLVWVEPGRSDCFEQMRAFRERVIASGEGVVLAPCTGQGRCPFSPLKEAVDDPDEVPLDDSAWQTFGGHQVGPGWCHFSARLERRTLHRALKQGSLSYEDEKFCYLIVARKGAVELALTPFAVTPLASMPPASRIMEDPKVRSGHVKMALCDSNTLSEGVVTKTDKPAFRLAKKAKWGDVWPQEIDASEPHDE